MRLLVDTSVLARLRDADSPAHSVCIEAIERLRAQSAELCICTQALIEFWSVSTRPREVNGMGRTPEETYQDCGLFLQVFRLLDEPADIAHRLSRIDIFNRSPTPARLESPAGRALVLRACPLPRRGGTLPPTCPP